MSMVGGGSGAAGKRAMKKESNPKNVHTGAMSRQMNAKNNNAIYSATQQLPKNLSIILEQSISIILKKKLPGHSRVSLL